MNDKPAPDGRLRLDELLHPARLSASRSRCPRRDRARHDSRRRCGRQEARPCRSRYSAVIEVDDPAQPMSAGRAQAHCRARCFRHRSGRLPGARHRRFHRRLHAGFAGARRQGCHFGRRGPWPTRAGAGGRPAGSTCWKASTRAISPARIWVSARRTSSSAMSASSRCALPATCARARGTWAPTASSWSLHRGGPRRHRQGRNPEDLGNQAGKLLKTSPSGLRMRWRALGCVRRRSMAAMGNMAHSLGG